MHSVTLIIVRCLFIAGISLDSKGASLGYEGFAVYLNVRHVVGESFLQWPPAVLGVRFPKSSQGVYG